MKKSWILIVMFVGAMAGGCAQEDISPGTRVSPEAFKAWKQDRCYYALLEIVDSHIDPNYHKASKEDVRKYLGNDYGEGYPAPQKGAQTWWYSSTRQIPQGSHLLISFDSNNIVKTVNWVSE